MPDHQDPTKTDENPAPTQVVVMDRLEPRKLVITQANALAMASYKITLHEKRLLSLLMAQVRMTDEEFKVYRIPITEVSRHLGINSTAIYTRIEKVTGLLMSRVLHLEDEEGEWVKIQWVSMSRYVPKKKSDVGYSYLELQLHPALAPMLLNLQKHFGSVPLHQIAAMPSVYSIRIYELLHFGTYGMRKREIYFDLEDLKRRIGVEKAFKNFAHFRRDVLERAQTDCAANTPLAFVWEVHKDGRKVVGITFFLRKTNRAEEMEDFPAFSSGRDGEVIQGELALDDDTAPAPTPEQREAMDEIRENGVAESTAGQLLENYPADRILKNARLAAERYAAGEVKKSLGAYTVAAIREDYAAEISPREKKAVARREKEAERRAHEFAAERQLGELQSRFWDERKAQVDEEFARLSVTEQEHAEADFSKTLPDAMRRIYKRSGKDAATVRAMWINFITERMGLLTADDFHGWAKAEGVEVEMGPDGQWKIRQD